jgi:hypothetical protein
MRLHMHGKKYVEAALQPNPNYNYVGEAHRENVQTCDEPINTLLTSLYQNQEVALLGDQPASYAVLVAKEARDHAKELRARDADIVAQRHKRLTALGYSATRDRRRVIRPADDTDGISPEDLRERSDQSRIRTHIIAAETSTANLAMAVEKVHDIDPATSHRKDKVATAISNVIKNNRRAMAAGFRPLSGIISVTSTMADDKHVTYAVSAERGRMLRTPKWINEHTDWDKALHYLTSTIEEIDVYLALHEWVIARKLPYMPIIAPSSIEHSNIKFANGSLRADVLLCGLHDNDIIPIQVKNKITQGEIDQYNDEVVLLDARDLSEPEISHPIVKGQDGSSHVGNAVTQKYGTVVTSFTDRHMPHSQQSKKVQPYLDTPFRWFDEKILPKVA